MRPHAKLTLFALLASATATPAAFADVPDPRFSTCEPVIVATSSGTPLGAPGEVGTLNVPGYEVVIRDVNNAPLAGRLVEIDFTRTTVRLYTAQSPGTTVDCARRVLAKSTGAGGLALFSPRFGGFENSNLVRVYDKGELLCSIRARSTDIDAMGGTTALGDLALFAQNFLSNQAAQETDFDVSGTTGLTDLVAFAAEFIRAQSSEYCP
ncbi:MAG: hypothetical protein ACREOU_08435 [Candidatus Eiseniibacteriota bacterium]